MSEQTFITMLLQKMNEDDKALIEFPFNAVCGDIFEGKPATEHEVAMRLISFRSLYDIDYILAFDQGIPPSIRFWKTKEIALIPEPEQIITQEGEELCHTSLNLEGIGSTAS
jgi:hypothetical protein